MQVKQSLYQKSITPPLTQHDFLKVIDIRGNKAFAAQKNLYKSLHAGEMGEQTVLDYIAQYGDPSWTILRNIWINHFGNLECDLILITRHTIYVIEVKNYIGKFSYKNGKCYFNDKETKLNPLEQVRGNKIDLQNILANIYSHLTVEALVIFASADNDVEIQSEVNEIKIITRAQLRSFIQQLKHKEQTGTKTPLDINKILAALHTHETTNPFMPDPLTPGEMVDVRGGIYCAHCYSFNVHITRLYIRCACGLTESKEEAVIRTICDLGVLNYKKHLSRKEINEFLAGDVSINYVRRILNKHFKTVNKSRNSYIINDGQPYEATARMYTIDQPKILQTKW